MDGFMRDGWSWVDVLGPLIGSLVIGSILVGIFGRGSTKVDHVRVWARSQGLILTEGNLPFARWFCQLNVMLRVTGGAAGVVLGAAFDDAFGLDTSAGYGFWAWVIVGWMLGAAWAERRLIRPGEPGAASLLRRGLDDYLPRGLVLAAPAVAGLTVLLAVIGIVAGPPQPGALTMPFTDRTYVVVAALALLLAGLAFLLERSVLDRPQPLMAPDLIAADDAVRASTLHNIAAAAAGALWCIVGVLGQAVVLPAGSVFGWLRGALLVAPLVGMVVSWRYWAFRAWAVRRGPAAVVSA